MYPFYRHMDSYPQACHPHREQPSYPQHVYPSWESPFNGTCRYFSPGDCNGCWNYAYPPAPCIPYPHPQPPQHHIHGTYPPCPNGYPAYFIPPPQYLVDQGRSHCCGCPNHSCQKKDASGLIIEEENPGIESKDSGSSGMTRCPPYPYPVVWFPPDQMKDNDHKTPRLKDNSSSTMIQWPTHPYPYFWFPPDHMNDNKHKPSEPQQLGPMDRWIPLDTNSLKPFRESGEKKIQNQQDGAKRMQLPLPIIWMPSYDQSQEAEKIVNNPDASPSVAEDVQPKLKIIPVNLLESDNCNEKPGPDNVNPGSQTCPPLPDKGSRHKNIPVKHLEESGPKKSDHPEKQVDYHAEKLTSLEEQKMDNQDKKSSNDGTKKQTSGRSSKLPPVCLRVDPLPRKKKGSDSPRSPSPTGNKEVKDNHQSKESKAAGSGGLGESRKDATVDKEVRVVGEEDKSNGKFKKDGINNVVRAIVVEDGSASKTEGEEKNQNKSEVDSMENDLGVGIEIVPGTGKTEEMAKHEKMDSGVVSFGQSENKIEDCKNIIEVSDVMKSDDGTGRKHALSETDAVLHIQAAYRGYVVRRWQPLEKLRQIARIRKQVSSIEQQMHNLEVSSEGGQPDEKQKLFIGETIMNLLLQLDTIQGLHPCVREIRKSVARDLVSLQEKLDVLSSKAPRGHVHVEARAASALGHSKNALEDVQSNSDSVLEKPSSPQEEPAQPNTEDCLVYSAAGKEERTGEQLLVGHAGQDSTPSNKQLLAMSDEQMPNLETGLSAISESGIEEPCYSIIEEYATPPTPVEVGVDSMTYNVSELPTREVQQGMQDEVVEASVKDDSPVDVDIYLQEDDKAEAKAEELHETQAKQGAMDTQPLSATASVALQEEENVLQDEEEVPAVDDLRKILEHEPIPSLEGSESPQLYEDSAASNMQKGETRPSELLHDPLLGCCAEVDDTVSTVLPCSESIVPEVDVNEHLTSGKEFEEPPRYESVNPEVVANEGEAEQPKVEILDAPLRASSAGVDLAEVDDNNTTPTLLVEEEDISGQELPKGVGSLLARNAIGTECSTEPTSPTRASVYFQVPDIEQTSVDVMEHERKLSEENENLREMLQKLLEAGNKQLAMITSLNGRVKDLEKKVAGRRKLRVKQYRKSNNLDPKAAVESAV